MELCSLVVLVRRACAYGLLFGSMGWIPQRVSANATIVFAQRAWSRGASSAPRVAATAGAVRRSNCSSSPVRWLPLPSRSSNDTASLSFPRGAVFPKAAAAVAAAYAHVAPCRLFFSLSLLPFTDVSSARRTTRPSATPKLYEVAPLLPSLSEHGVGGCRVMCCSTGYCCYRSPSYQAPGLTAYACSR